MRRLIPWILALPLGGCVAGQATTPTAESSASFESRYCGSEMPEVTYLERWDGTTPLWPEGVTRGVTLTYESPDSSDRFRAYLVDISSYRVVLQMDGDKRDYTYFTALDDDAVQQLRDVLSHTAVTQLTVRPPRPKPRGDDPVEPGIVIDQAVRIATVTERPAVCTQ